MTRAFPAATIFFGNASVIVGNNYALIGNTHKIIPVNVATGFRDIPFLKRTAQGYQQLLFGRQTVVGGICHALSVNAGKIEQIFYTIEVRIPLLLIIFAAS